jgi:hypothetical protein
MSLVFVTLSSPLSWASSTSVSLLHPVSLIAWLLDVLFLSDGPSNDHVLTARV